MFEKLDALSRVICSQLEPSLLKKEYQQENETNHTFGHCYVATETMFHLIRILDYNDCLDYKPHCAKDETGTTHWWLEADGDIIDITKNQYIMQGRLPPYEKGKRCSFLTKKPSKRAVKLINKIQKKCASVA